MAPASRIIDLPRVWAAYRAAVRAKLPILEELGL